MKLKKILTDEYLDYKMGFVNGKNDALTTIISGIPTEEFPNEYNWYTLGYDDAFSFYYDYCISNGAIDLNWILGETSFVILENHFLDRVMAINCDAEARNKEDEKIPYLRILTKFKKEDYGKM